MGQVFDVDEYEKGRWKTAVEQQDTHYQRLGFSAHEHIDASDVRKALIVRSNWWMQRKSQADSGKNNPLIAELIPHFKIAERNLKQASDVLGDVDQRAAYDRHIAAAGAKAAEDKLQEFIRFTLRDKILTPTEKNDLLDSARELGILRERAEELIRQEMTKTGSQEADDPLAGVAPQRDPTTPVVHVSAARGGAARSGRRRKYLVFVAVICFGYIAVKAVIALNYYLEGVNKEMAHQGRNYNPNYICPNVQLDDAKGINNHREKHEEWFTITLTEGCFGSWVRPPWNWKTWNVDFADPNQPGQYYAIWYDSWPDAVGLYYPGHSPTADFQDHMVMYSLGSGRWRLQGKGTLRYIRTSSTPFR